VTKTYFGMGLDSSGVFPILASRPGRLARSLPARGFMHRRLAILAADPGISRFALPALCLLLAACKQGSGGGGY
ncbi:MAG: hypothetical protein ABJB65_07420, partial [Chloroflexota bacterium]